MSASSGPSVLLLGPVRVADAHGTRDVPARRQRSVLAALAVHTGRAVTVSDLVDAVWDDDPPEHARNTLQSYVSRLRAAFGPIIEHGPGGYRLADHVGTDVADVRRVAEQVHTAGADPDARARAALAALARWTGPALGDLRDDLWFAGAVAELDELEASLLDIAASSLIEAGRPQPAVAALEGRATERLAREPTQTLLVRALHAAGRTTEALRAADRYRSWLREETGLVPGAAFTAAERQALDGTPPAAPPDRSASGGARPTPPPLPADLTRPTPLLGRGAELAVLRQMLRDGRLATVTGVGGIGKSRLVAELVAELPDAGRRVLGLAPTEPGGVAAALAASLGYRDDVTDLRVLVELLRTADGVLVLDNAEHVLGEVRRVVRSLLDGCPDLTMLVTSRSRLDLPEEQVLALAPLAVEGDGAPAVELFLDRLRRARSGSRVDPDPDAVIDVCTRLDGVPLALELAASRAAVFGIDVIATRLEAPVDVLASSVEPEGRHASLANLVEWSVGLVDGAAQRVLAALGVFHGTFDVVAAEAVAGPIVDEPVAPVLGRLVDASLVAPGERDGEHRLLQMVRDVARRKLHHLDGLVGVRTAHAEWVAGELRAVDADAAGPAELATSGRLDRLRPEIDAALGWARQSGHGALVAEIVAPLAGPLLYRPDHELVVAVRDAATDADVPATAATLAAGARGAFLLGELTEVEGLAHRALDIGPPMSAASHRAAHALGVVRLYQGRFEESRRWFQRVIDADPATVSLVDRLDALGGLGLAVCYAGDRDRAGTVVAQHRALADVSDSVTYRAFGTYMAAEHCLLVGDVDRATEELVQASELAWSVGARFVWGIASTVLASILVRYHPPAAARRHLPTLIERWRGTATWPQLWTTLRLVAESIHAGGRADVALLVLAAADSDPAAPTVVGADAERLGRLRSALESELGPAADGIVAAAAVVDRAVVLDRAIAALSDGVSATQA